ncbi:MAG: glycerol-3-phosphate acyltransferase [Chloroflexota bacterium]|nr:glycerol-3-phosphate acyltransferase [Chloroflexota bacterium]
MSIALWTVIGFVLGSMPFSLWLGRLIGHTDVRSYGDGNPGGVNAFRAGGWRIGVPAILLDYLKAGVPVGLAYFVFGVSGWGLVPVALAPVLGHAFSPFLRFRGGKAVSTTFGTWSGLTLWAGPTVLGISLGILYALQVIDTWAIMAGMLVLLVYLLLWQPDAALLAAWGGNALILAWKHRSGLRDVPRPRPWLSHLLKGRR